MVRWPCRWRHHVSLVSFISFLFPATASVQQSLTKEWKWSALICDTVMEKEKWRMKKKRFLCPHLCWMSWSCTTIYKVSSLNIQTRVSCPGFRTCKYRFEDGTTHDAPQLVTQMRKVRCDLFRVHYWWLIENQLQHLETNNSSGYFI